MAFFSMFLLFLAGTVIVIGICTLIAVILYIIAACITHSAKKKAASQPGTEYKRPKSVLVLRIIGTVFMVPLIGAMLLIGYGILDTKMEQQNNLGYAVACYDFEETERLLEKGVNPDCKLDSKEAATNGERTLLASIIEDNSDSLKEHSEEDKIRMAKLLIEHGADINYVSYYHEKGIKRHTRYDESDYYNVSDTCGYTPLMFAVRTGDFELVQILVEQGADVNVVDYCGFNVIATIADNLNDEQGEEMLQYLLNAGASSFTKTNFGQNASFLAFRNSQNMDNDGICEILDELTYGKLADYLE